MTIQTNITVGYKGHRAGSMKEKAHKLTDELLTKKKDRQFIINKLVKQIGMAQATANTSYAQYKAWSSWGKTAALPTQKKPMAKKQKKTVKKAAKKSQTKH